MLPDPLHPAVVHFPIVLACLLPVVAAGALWAIHRGASASRAWAMPLLFAAALSASAWAAIETGEDQAERVERTVGEQRVDAHGEMAKGFLVGSVVLLTVAAIGLARGRLGGSARVLATAGSVALVLVAARVGHSGGQLVYKFGAASPYVTSGASGVESAESSTAPRGARSLRDRDADDR